MLDLFSQVALTAAASNVRREASSIFLIVLGEMAFMGGAWVFASNPELNHSYTIMLVLLILSCVASVLDPVPWTMYHTLLRLSPAWFHCLHSFYALR